MLTSVKTACAEASRKTFKQQTMLKPEPARVVSHAHHDRRRAALQDILVAVRCRTSLEGCEQERRGNHEAVLLAPEKMFDRFPAAVG